MPEIQECGEAENCRNSITRAGMHRTKCGLCRLAPDAENITVHAWSPVAGAKHPTLEAEKRQKGRDRALAAHRQRLSRNPGKMRVQRRAERAERSTEQSIISATKNSGRSRQDGDHLAAGQVTLDTKLQSMRDHPVVMLHELGKVREDSANARTLCGGLVLRNKHGVGVVVFAEEDFAKILARL
jgi:hypothetical protein